MKPFRPNAKQTLKNYYGVPLEIIEDRDELCEWAMKAIGCQIRALTPTLSHFVGEGEEQSKS